MNIIEIKNLNFHYTQDKPVLKDINLTIRKGEWISILGHNGSGKSTLSKLIIGLLKAKSGDIYIDDILLSYETVYDIRKKVGIVFQNPDNQFVGVTVRDDIAFGLENLQVPREEMIERIETFAHKVNMSEFLNKEPHALSGGQKQRVAIAGILAMNTDIIIFDEATSMLDPKGRRMILNYMQQLSNEGKTIITITHDMKEAVLSDRIVVLKNGEILKVDTSENILRDKETLEKSNLELLLPLKIMYKLEESNINKKELRDYLWALSLNV
ncbi:energy-coupling factor transporter ATPase [Liberiplasma polymorphum]|uniref:energy-coupling factor transporter ATPase n=1 Tax=Liberiplasma polymorphum TaxID=3374570 RepID=UPI0037723196